MRTPSKTDPILSALHDIEVASLLIQDALLRIQILRVEGKAKHVPAESLDGLEERLSLWGMTLMFSAISLSQGGPDVTEASLLASGSNIRAIEQQSRAALNALRRVMQ